MSRKVIHVTEKEMQAQESAMITIYALPNKPKTYHIITYGCQMNSHDSEKLAGFFTQMGIASVQEKEEADIVIFNTCCIRDNAERRALGNVNWLNELRKKKPDLLIGICGCMVQQPHMAEKILKQYRFIDIAFGTHNLHCFPEMLLRLLVEKQRVVCISNEETLIAEGLPVKRLSPTHAYITIMYGCDNFCSFCIVPFVRGRERSRELKDIVAEAEKLYAEGVQEIMLLGQNVNSYGRYLQDGSTFPKLLEELDKIGIPRIRFMTSHPKDLSDELIAVMGKSQHICPQFHLPVQSGNNEILKKMNRRYTVESYKEKVRKLREAVPSIAITTDLIVGFPTETEEQFEDTCQLVRDIGYTSAFTFVYSPRTGTKAAELPQIDKQIGTQRIQKLLAIVEENTLKAHEAMVGMNEIVLVDSVSNKQEGMVFGKGVHGVSVLFEGTSEDIGKCIPVTIHKAGLASLQAIRKDKVI